MRQRDLAGDHLVIVGLRPWPGTDCRAPGRQRVHPEPFEVCVVVPARVRRRQDRPAEPRLRPGCRSERRRDRRRGQSGHHPNLRAGCGSI
jgi:hypothetical protein